MAEQIDPITGLPIKQGGVTSDTLSSKRRDLTGLRADSPYTEGIDFMRGNANRAMPQQDPITGAPTLPGGYTPFTPGTGRIQGGLEEDYAPYTGLGVNPAYQDIDEMRAENQPWYEQMGYGVLRATGKASIEVMKLPAVLGGFLGWMGTGFELGKFDEYINNDFIQGLNDMDASMKGALPVHLTHAVEDGNILTKLSSSAWWGSTGADGIGFLAAMMAPGAAFKAFKLGTRLSRLFGELPRQIFSDAMMANKFGGKALGATLDDGIGAFTNTMYESLIEAGSVADELKRSQYEKNGMQPLTDEQKELIGRRGLATFLTNVAILTVPNYIQVKGMFGGAKKVDGDDLITKLINTKTGELVENMPKVNVFGRAVKGFGSGFVREGMFEEGLQWAAEKAALDTRSSGIASYLGNVFGNYIDGMSDGSSEWWEGVALGGILGGGMNSFQKMQQAQAEKEGMGALHELLGRSYTNYKTNTGGIFKKNEDGSLATEVLESPDGTTTETPQIDWEYVQAQKENHEALFDFAVQLDDAIARKDSKAVRDLFAMNTFADFAMAFITRPGGLKALENVIDRYSFGEEEALTSMGGQSEAKEYKEQLKSLAKSMAETYQTVDNYGPDFFGVEYTPEMEKKYSSKELTKLRNSFYQMQKEAAVLNEVRNIYSNQLIEKVRKDLDTFRSEAQKSRIAAGQAKKALEEVEPRASQAQEQATEGTEVANQLKKEVQELTREYQGKKNKRNAHVAKLKVMSKRLKTIEDAHKKYLAESEEIYDKAKMQKAWENFYAKQVALEQLVKESENRAEKAKAAAEEYLEKIRMALQLKGYDPKVLENGRFFAKDKDGNLIIIRAKDGELSYRVAPLNATEEARQRARDAGYKRLTTAKMKSFNLDDANNLRSNEEAARWGRLASAVSRNMDKMEALESILAEREAEKKHIEDVIKKHKARLEEMKGRLAAGLELQKMSLTDAELDEEVRAAQQEVEDLQDLIDNLRSSRIKVALYVRSLQEMRDELQQLMDEDPSIVISLNKHADRIFNKYIRVLDQNGDSLDSEFGEKNMAEDLDKVQLALDIVNQDINALEKMRDNHQQYMDTMWNILRQRIPEFVAEYQQNGKFTPQDLYAHLGAWIIKQEGTTKAKKLLATMPNPWSDTDAWLTWLDNNREAYYMIRHSMIKFPMMSMDFIREVVMTQAEINRLQRLLAPLYETQKKLMETGKLLSDVENLYAVIPDIQQRYVEIRAQRTRIFDKAVKQHMRVAGYEVEQAPVGEVELEKGDRSMRKIDPYSTTSSMVEFDRATGQMAVDPDTGMPLPTTRNPVQARVWNRFMNTPEASEGGAKYYIRYVNNKQLAEMGVKPPVEDDDALYAVVMDKANKQPVSITDEVSGTNNVVYTGIAKTDTNFGPNGLIDIERAAVMDKAVTIVTKNGKKEYFYNKKKFETWSDVVEEYGRDKRIEYNKWRTDILKGLAAGEQLYSSITNVSNGIPIRNLKGPVRSVEDAFADEDFDIVISNTLKDQDTDGYSSLTYKGTTINTYPGRVHVGISRTGQLVRVENRQLGEMGEEGAELMDYVARMIAYGNEMDNLNEEVDLGGGFTRRVFPYGSEHGLINDIINFGVKNQKVDGKFVQNRQYEIFIVENKGKGTRKIIFRSGAVTNEFDISKIYKVDKSGRIKLNEDSFELKKLRDFLKTKYLNVSRRTLQSPRNSASTSDKSYFALVDNINVNTKQAYTSTKFKAKDYKSFVAKFALKTQIITATPEMPRIVNRYFQLGGVQSVPPAETPTPKPTGATKQEVEQAAGMQGATPNIPPTTALPLDTVAGKYFRDGKGNFLVYVPTKDGKHYLTVLKTRMSNGQLVIDSAQQGEIPNFGDLVQEINDFKEATGAPDGVPYVINNLASLSTLVKGSHKELDTKAVQDVISKEVGNFLTTNFAELAGTLKGIAVSFIEGATAENTEKARGFSEFNNKKESDQTTQQPAETKQEVKPEENNAPPQHQPPTDTKTPETEQEEKDKCNTESQADSAKANKSFDKLDSQGFSGNNFNNIIV